MSDLPDAEREAMERASGHVGAGKAAWEAGWRAARAYYTDPAYCAACGGPCRDESPVRLSEVDVERVKAWLEKQYGTALEMQIGEWGGDEDWDGDARELLTLVLGTGEEAKTGG